MNMELIKLKVAEIENKTNSFLVRYSIDVNAVNAEVKEIGWTKELRVKAISLYAHKIDWTNSLLEEFKCDPLFEDIETFSYESSVLLGSIIYSLNKMLLETIKDLEELFKTNTV